jgi:(p)ppGpp synthase/HD superfamily hydrolase
VASELRPPFLSDLPLTGAALEFAAEHHEGQRRSDAAPFILHPLEVALLLLNRGYDDEVVAAGILHDTIESTDATSDELRERFGPQVCALVAVLSEDTSIEDEAEQKAALRRQVADTAPPEALAIYAADKVSKARELRARLSCNPATRADEDVVRKIEHYRASVELLQERLPDHPLTRQLAFELWALDALPPTAE